MNKHKQEKVSLVEELKDHWGPTTGCCHCGCGQSTKNYFAPGGDSRFAAKLLEALRGRQDIADITQQLAGCPG